MPVFLLNRYLSSEIRETIAVFGGSLIKKVDPAVADMEPYEVLEAIGRKRGMLLRGNEVDTERAANTLLTEYRSGKLGKITLERPKG